MEIKQNTIYTHYKGAEYLVLFIADESTNSRAGKVVVYVSLTYGKVKVRDLEEFIEPVTWSDGVERPRFILKTLH